MATIVSPGVICADPGYCFLPVLPRPVMRKKTRNSPIPLARNTPNGAARSRKQFDRHNDMRDRIDQDEHPKDGKTDWFQPCWNLRVNDKVFKKPSAAQIVRNGIKGMK